MTIFCEGLCCENCMTLSHFQKIHMIGVFIRITMLRLSVSIGKGNTMVELCSVEIALSVCKQVIDHCPSEDEGDLEVVGVEQDAGDEEE